MVVLVAMVVLVVWWWFGSGSGSGSGGYGGDAVTNNATIYLNGAPAGDGDALAEGDVISIYGDIHVDHDGSFESPEILLSDNNNFYSDSSVLGGSYSSMNATFKFYDDGGNQLAWTSPGNPHSYTVTADDVLNTDYIYVNAIVEYYDSVNDSYNTLTGNGHDGQQITMLPIAMPVDGGGSSGGGSGYDNSERGCVFKCCL